MRYCVRDDPPFEEGADQVRATDALCGTPERNWGADGTVAPETETEVVAVTDPTPFVAVRVYNVVEVGETMKEPVLVEVEKLPGAMDTDDAFAVFQERVLDAPKTMLDGDAENEKMVGEVVAWVISGSPAVLSK